MGLSYPANAGWRLWALAHGRRIDAVLADLRTRWASMPSVAQNNTLAEVWKPAPDSGDLWSHCPVVPLYIMGMGIAGLQPLDAGWQRILIAPQPGDLTSLDATVHTPGGELSLESRGPLGDRIVRVKVPAATEGVLAVDPRESGLPFAEIPSPIPGTKAFRLPGGVTSSFTLRHT
jgi:hypothetical protein